MESSILNAICTKSFLGAEPTLPQKPCKIQEDEATIDAILQILKDDTKEQIGCKLERILPLSSNDESGKEEAPSLFREVLFRINLE
ncbi:MAG: hypothetical protein H6767_08995 [Candidatus Peribacteria bacterium]|nr:MAG: hypothetical protein H6767_08995 [Candidatus Peribacteria bacterium]